MYVKFGIWQNRYALGVGVAFLKCLKEGLSCKQLVFCPPHFTKHPMQQNTTTLSSNQPDIGTPIPEIH